MKGECVITIGSGICAGKEIFNQPRNIKNGEREHRCTLYERVHQRTLVAVLTHNRRRIGMEITITTTRNNHISVSRAVAADQSVNIITGSFFEKHCGTGFAKKHGAAPVSSAYRFSGCISDNKQRLFDITRRHNRGNSLYANHQRRTSQADIVADRLLRDT